jgi:hypothetical protein
MTEQQQARAQGEQDAAIALAEQDRRGLSSQAAPQNPGYPTVYVRPLAGDDPQPAGPGTERTRSATGRGLKPAG